MQFGVQFFPAVDHTDKSAADYFAKSLDIVEEGEKLGFTHARTVEHYFNRYGGYSTNPIVFSQRRLAAFQDHAAGYRRGAAGVRSFRSSSPASRELDGISNGGFDIGFARAFLLHEFRRFGISPDKSQVRFREGLEQIELLLTQESATHKGQFHSFENVTSLPRPTQKPRPKFYIAATQTPKSFEFAGRKGYSLMAIPIGPISGLIELYRKSWRDAGHPGDGEVVVAFHIFCHEIPDSRARSPGRRSKNISAHSMKRRATGSAARPKDYRDYDTSMRRLRSFTLDGQIEAGGACGRHAGRDQGDHPQGDGRHRQVRARLAADQFRQYRRPRRAEIDAAVLPRGDAGIRRCGRSPHQALAGRSKPLCRVGKGAVRAFSCAHRQGSAVPTRHACDIRVGTARSARPLKTAQTRHARLCPPYNLSPTLRLRYLRGEQRQIDLRREPCARSAISSAARRSRAASGRSGDVFNPNTGEVQAKVALAKHGRGRAAIANAEAAQPAWAATNPQRRARVMFKFLELCSKEYDEPGQAAVVRARQDRSRRKGDIQRGARGGRVRLRHPAPDEGRVYRERRPRHRPLFDAPAARRRRRHHAVQLSRR